MKIEFDSDKNILLNKTMEIPTVTIVARAVFHENDKYYPQVFLDGCLQKIYKLQIDVSERADVNKTNASKESDVCHYWYLLNYSFKFQPNVCNRCHDLLMSVNFSDIAILNVQGPDYSCIITLISKNEAINFLYVKIFLLVCLSRHEQVCLSGLLFERYFSHHWAA